MKHTKDVTNQLKIVVINPRFPIKSRCKSCSNLHFSSVFLVKPPFFPWFLCGSPWGSPRHRVVRHHVRVGPEASEELQRHGPAAALLAGADGGVQGDL